MLPYPCDSEASSVRLGSGELKVKNRLAEKQGWTGFSFGNVPWIAALAGCLAQS